VTLEEGLRRTVRWYLDNEGWWQAIQARGHDGAAASGRGADAASGLRQDGPGRAGARPRAARGVAVEALGRERADLADPGACAAAVSGARPTR
jgi:hypothetical protein